MQRIVEPELLDELTPADPRALGSRADLRRLNFLMGHAGILSRALRRPMAEISIRAHPLRMVELGAGDGTLLLRMARRLSAAGLTAQATLLDRQNLVSMETRRLFTELNWSIECVAADAFTWLEQPGPAADLMIANLFLHHFQEEKLARLLRLAAERTRVFIACEPRRSPGAPRACRWLWLIGCNAVTRHDAEVSVRAGFAGRELSALWPAPGNWTLHERAAGLFSHCFISKNNA